MPTTIAAVSDYLQPQGLGPPTDPFTHVIVAGDTVYVAGQIALDENGDVVGEGDFETQTRQVFMNMGRVLELAGMSFDNVVQIGGFLIDIGQLPTYARVRDEFVNTSAPPASTTIGVTSLALPELLVEVNAIAAS
jgi:enamine deaminase RidA (YjgF/YER057c/UK114 family)